MGFTIPQKLQLASKLIDTRVALERKDEELEVYAYQGDRSNGYKTTPDVPYAIRTSQLGRDISALAAEFATVYSGKTALIERLTRAGSYVSACGGAQHSMAHGGRPFGNDWGTAYDAGCSALRAAAQAVFADIEKQAFVAPNR